MIRLVSSRIFTNSNVPRNNGSTNTFHDRPYFEQNPANMSEDWDNELDRNKGNNSKQWWID